MSLVDVKIDRKSNIWILERVKGGPGSGNFGHAGRPGKRGGSAPGIAGHVPSDIRSMRFYHATDSEEEAQSIMRDGFVKPGKGGRGKMDPVAGRAYFTSDPEYAAIYALGGDMAGHDVTQFPGFMERGQHGYIFEFRGGDFGGDIQPDEDSIGEALYHKQYDWLDDLARKHVPAAQRRRIMDGEYADWASAGKKLVRHMSDEQKFQMIRDGAHVAHSGAVRPRKVWSLDKADSINLEKRSYSTPDTPEMRQQRVDKIWEVVKPVRIDQKGGPGSGHHGHSGRPGKRGGSSPGGGSLTSTPSPYTREASFPFGDEEIHLKKAGMVLPSELPPPKEGYVRLYHSTGGHNLESIEEEGLLTSKATADRTETGTIHVTWGTGGPDDYSTGKHLVVFDVPEEYARKVNSTDYIVRVDVPPSDIIATYPVVRWGIYGHEMRRWDKILDTTREFGLQRVIENDHIVPGVRSLLADVFKEQLESQKGGPGSGHHGHGGRPGQRGGSVPGSGVPAAIRERARNPYIGVPADVMNPGDEAYRMSPRPEQPTGAPIRGKAIPVDDPRIPETVYHMTTNLSAVRESGVLLAKGAGGLGGDRQDQIVSMTISKDIAYQLADDTRFVALLADKYLESQPPWASHDDPDRDAKRAARDAWGRPLVAEFQAQAQREGWEFGIASEFQFGEYGLRDWITQYYTQRSINTDKLNPIFFSSAEELLAINVNNIGVVDIPKQNLKTGALLTDFDLGQGHLEEIRLYGDVPLQNATYAAVKQLSESFFDLQEEDMKEITVLIDDGAPTSPAQLSFDDWEKDLIADIKAVTKSEQDGKHPSSHYLVVGNPEQVTTWHLRVRDAQGNVDHRLMGAAWAALHGGYRGNKYEGPDKDKAISKLRALYKSEDMPVPGEDNKQVSTCTCPECGYKMDHERGTPCREKECPECGAKMAGSNTGAETTTASGNAGRAVIAGTSSGVEAQIKEGGILKALADEFRGLKQALKDLITPSATDISAMITSSIATKAMSDAIDHGSSFISFKATDGRDWLLTFTTNAFLDREAEIFSTKSINDYVERHESDDIKGEYQFWHFPGTAFGDIRWQGVVGRFLVEAGPYRDTPVGRAFKSFFDAYPDGHPEIAPDGWGCSHRYEYKSDDREDGVYEWFEKSESTILPLDAAANPYTAPLFINNNKENAMNDRQRNALKLIGGDQLLTMVETVGKKATADLEAKVEYKDTRDPVAELVELAEGLDNDEAKKSLISIAEDLKKKLPPWLEKKPAKGDDEEDEEDEEDMEEDEKKPAKKKQAEEAAPEAAPAEAPADEAAAAEDAPVPAPAEEAPADDAPAPEVTGDKEYQAAVAESFQILVKEMNDQFTAIREEMKGLRGTVDQVQRDDEEKIAEKAVETPAASLLSMVQRAVGAKENRVDGRTGYAKEGPREAPPADGDGPSPIPMLNAFMTNADQKQQ